MKKIALLLLSTLLLLVSAPTASAQEFKSKSVASGELVTVEEDEVIDRDYLISGETVEFYGTINGDLYAVGGQVTINGTVNGDLLAAGGNVVVNGKVTQDARLFGGQVTITGEIGRNLTIGAGTLDIGSSASISGSLVGGAGTINLAGPINGNVAVGAGSLVVSNKIGGDLETGVSELRLTSKAEIGGDVNYWSENDALVSDGTSIGGTISKEEAGKFVDKELEDAKKGFGAMSRGLGGIGRLTGFLSALLVGYLLLKLYPKFAQATAETIKTKPWPSLGIGAIALFMFPIAFVIMLITIIGIPIAFILLAGYLIYIYLAKLFVALLLGNFLSGKLNKKLSPFWTFALGLVAYSVVIELPFVGGLAQFLTLLFGLGAMLIACKQTHEEARKKEVI